MSGQSSIVSEPSKLPRVASIDALRGFDMFWIIGGDAVARLLLSRSDSTFAATLKEQLSHAEWEGFRFYDLIFPLFLFLVGCTLPFSLEKYRASASQVYGRIARRTALLVLMGFVLNRIFDLKWDELRYCGVLQRIGICYGAAAMIFLHTRARGQFAIVAGILLGYWAVMAWVAAPGSSPGDLSPAGNLAGYIDRSLLPGKIYEAFYGHGDNEGLLSTLPAIATTLMGVLAGNWLRTGAAPLPKAAGLAASGLACVLLGHLWGLWFPIIKILWTSSFVLVAGGWSLLLLALFYAAIDGMGWKSWAFFWIVIGMNAITIYVAQRIIGFEQIARFFLNGLATHWSEYRNLILASGTLLAKWLFLWFLYRHRIFLRL